MFRDSYLHIKTINKTRGCYYKNKDSGAYLGVDGKVYNYERDVFGGVLVILLLIF